MSQIRRCTIDIFLDSHVSSQEKATDRKVHVRGSGISLCCLSRSNASPESVSRFEMENQMEVSIASTCSDVEMEAMNSNELSEVETCDNDWAEAIARKNKRITDLEQEIAELKSKLQNARRQITNLENVKSKNNTAPFYARFNSWDVFEAVYNYLNPGERGENIVYWRSVNAEVSVDYDQDQLEESLTKKGRARSLRPVDECFYCNVQIETRRRSSGSPF